MLVRSERGLSLQHGARPFSSYQPMAELLEGILDTLARLCTDTVVRDDVAVLQLLMVTP